MTEQEQAAITAEAHDYAKYRALATQLKEVLSVPFPARVKAVESLRFPFLATDRKMSGNTFMFRMALASSLHGKSLVLSTVNPDGSDDLYGHVKPVAGRRKGKTMFTTSMLSRDVVQVPMVSKMNQFLNDYKQGKMPASTIKALNLIATGQV